MIAVTALPTASGNKSWAPIVEWRGREISRSREDQKGTTS
jgi:hypothetical protein